MTCARTWLAVCVMLTEILFTLICFAVFFASPPNAIVDRAPASGATSKSTHRTPRLPPVPGAFIAASFAANLLAYRSYLSRNRSQYSLSFAVYTRRKNASPCHSIAAFARSTSAISTPIPMINTPPGAQPFRAAASISYSDQSCIEIMLVKLWLRRKLHARNGRNKWGA